VLLITTRKDPDPACDIFASLVRQLTIGPGISMGIEAGRQNYHV